MKHLKLNHQTYPLIPLPTFIARWCLPVEFCVAYFEPKEPSGLGKLAGAGPALALVKERLLQAVPEVLTLDNLMTYAEGLGHVFEHELTAANAQIGLRPPEIEFAVAGFEDILRSVVYKLIQLRHLYRHDIKQIEQTFDFSAIYQDWLDDSTRLSGVTHTYPHASTQFEVKVLYNVYGRVGLAVTVQAETHYIYDPALGCPAANYMMTLGEAVAEAMCHNFCQDDFVTRPSR